MELSKKTKKALTSIFATAIVGSAIGGGGYFAYKELTTLPSVADDVTYLENHGYANVAPASGEAFSQDRDACAKGETSRTYEGTKDGKAAEIVLCSSSFYGFHIPRL